MHNIVPRKDDFGYFVDITLDTIFTMSPPPHGLVPPGLIYIDRDDDLQLVQLDATTEDAIWEQVNGILTMAGATLAGLCFGKHLTVYDPEREIETATASFSDGERVETWVIPVEGGRYSHRAFGEPEQVSSEYDLVAARLSRILKNINTKGQT